VTRSEARRPMLTFSIITPTVLRLTLQRTCRSIDEQRHTSWQHLVMVDKPEAALTTGEAEMLRRLAHPKREIRFCSQAHSDCGNSCRSNAWEHAAGDYILYCDDDDYLLPEALHVLQRDLDARDARPIWGVFPIQRFGQRFLLIPPGHSRTCSTQFFHQRRADGVDLRFPLAGHCADGVFIDSLVERFPYVCIDPGRPLAVVDQSNLGARVTLERGRFEAAFRDYVQNYSIETEAISLEASYYLLDVLAASTVKRILDLGSGWSSFVFRHFGHLSGRDIEICSVDTSEHWCGVTSAFLAKYEFGAKRPRLWPDIGEGLYDLRLCRHGTAMGASSASRCRVRSHGTHSDPRRHALRRLSTGLRVLCGRAGPRASTARGTHDGSVRPLPRSRRSTRFRREQMTLALVMPVVLQQAQMLDLTLDAVAHLQSRHPVTLFIVCNGLHLCTDADLTAQIRERFTGRVVIVNEPGVIRSVAGSWNEGARRAIDEEFTYIAAIANDVVLRPVALDCLADFWRNRRGGPVVGDQLQQPRSH
jgi:hypothetical protein